jgi:hypothetical protein
MAMNRIQFQPGLSMPAFAQRFGTESQCAAALEAARWPNGFSCPRCGGTAHCVLRGGSCKVFQCQACRHQTSLIAGTVFQGTKLPLTVWFLAIYLISQAKTGSMPFRVEADNSGLSSSHRFLMIETLFTLALGLVAPWQVDQVTFTPEAGRIDFQVKFGAASHACPACGAAAQPLHDRLARSWRHRDFFEYEARLHAEVPRVACAGCGKVTQILVPWAREGVAKVAVALKLDYKSLKHRLTARNAAEDARSAPDVPELRRTRSRPAAGATRLRPGSHRPSGPRAAHRTATSGQRPPRRGRA